MSIAKNGTTQAQRQLVDVALNNPKLAETIVKTLKQCGSDPASFAHCSRDHLQSAVNALPPVIYSPDDEAGFRVIAGQQAVVAPFTMDKVTFEIILSAGTYSKTRDEQEKYAKSLGCRLATRDEAMDYARSLLYKSGDNTFNEAEARVFAAFKRVELRHQDGRVFCEQTPFGSRVLESGLHRRKNDNFPHERVGALMVREPVYYF